MAPSVLITGEPLVLPTSGHCIILKSSTLGYVVSKNSLPASTWHQPYVSVEVSFLHTEPQEPAFFFFQSYGKESLLKQHPWSSNVRGDSQAPMGLSRSIISRLL